MQKRFPPTENHNAESRKDILESIAKRMARYGMNFGIYVTTKRNRIPLLDYSVLIY